MRSAACAISSRRQGVVGAGGDGDQVLAAGVDEDQGDAGGVVRVAQHAVDVHALAAEVLDRLVAENVAADLGDQRDAGAEPGGGHGLVRPLAPARHDESPADDRFPRGGQPLALDDHVDVHAADDDDVRSFHGDLRVAVSSPIFVGRNWDSPRLFSWPCSRNRKQDPFRPTGRRSPAPGRRCSRETSASAAGDAARGAAEFAPDEHAPEGGHQRRPLTEAVGDGRG